MKTTFVFIKEFNEQGYPCLVLDDNGDVLHPLATLDFNTIADLQTQGKTSLVLPCDQFSLHSLALPLLSEKKVRQALPYALEDNLTQPIEELHFCFDKHYFRDGHYLIAVCSQAYLLKIIAQFNELSLRFDVITLDWFALNEQESALLPHYALIQDDSFQGALSLPLATLFLKKLKNEHLLYQFEDSATTLKVQKLPKLIQVECCKSSSSLWIAKRLLEKKPMNLCQGLFQLKKTSTQIKRWYTLAAGLFAVWLITFLTINSYLLYLKKQDIHAVDSAIEKSYRHFFPEAKQIINPRFRITQLLKSNNGSSDEGFWLLLNKLTTTANKSPHNKAVTIEQINSQNHLLLVTLAVKDFKTLDAFENSLRQTGLQVKQTQASTKDAQVLSTLELSL